MTLGATERIAELRRRCLDRKCKTLFPAQVIVEAAKCFSSSSADESPQRRAGLRVKHVLGEMQFSLDELELFIGRPCREREDQLASQLPEAQQVCQRFVPPGQTGHCELDLSALFTLGIDGLRGNLSALAKSATGERADTYTSFLDAMDGLSRMIETAAETAEAAMKAADEHRRAELSVMSGVCRRIAHLPPASFREAIQLLSLVNFAVLADMVLLVGPGRLDRSLWRYYQADVQAGKLTRDEALQFIECLYLLVNETVVDGLAIAVMVGGRDEAGRDTTNELSYLSLEALRRTKLVYPTVGVCWHEGTPRELSDLAIELIAEGYTTPAFFNDDVIQRGLAKLGVPSEDRCRYINSTCVEITPCGASNVWVASPYYNLCGLLLEEIQAVSDNPPAEFEAFLRGYFDRVNRAIREAVAVQNQFRRERRDHGRKPLQSVFTRDCVARGLDIDAGGATYNWIECSFVGMANLADSLTVLRGELFDARSTTWPEFLVLLQSDFKNNEAARLRFLHDYPKYGQGNEAVDALLGQIASTVIGLCSMYRVRPDDSPYVPGSFCWIMHEMLGRDTGATPDGRHAGAPFADGGGPAQGRETLGPTAAILSTTSWDHSPMIGGLAYNMKFNASLFHTPATRDTLRGLVLTYLRLGGFETQINVVSRETLLAARADPEAYRDLVVRIGGYCDYFTRLSPQMQEEVLLRTEFGSLQ